MLKESEQFFSLKENKATWLIKQLYLLDTEEEMNIAKTLSVWRVVYPWSIAMLTLSVCHHPLWLTKEFWESYDSKTFPKWQKFSHSDLKEKK